MKITSLLALSLVCGVSGNSGLFAGNVKVDVQPGQFVAFQDGNSAWKVITSSQEVPVADAAGKFGLFEGPVGEAKNCTLTFATTGEEPKGKDGQDGKIEGTLANAPSAGSVRAFCCGSSSSVKKGAFTLNIFGGTTVDVGLVHYKDGEKGESVKATSALIERGVSTGSKLSIDFKKAVTLGSATANVTNIPSGFTLSETSAEFQTEKGGSFLAWGGAASGSSFSFPVMPANAVQPGDFYVITAAAYTDTQKVGVTVKSPNPGVTLNLPAAYNPPAPKLTSKSPVIISYSGIKDGFSSTISPEKEGGAVCVVNATKPYLAGQATLVLPNLSKLSGWKNDFLPSGTIFVTQDAVVESENSSTFAGASFTIK